ncbi:MAG: PorV/PorQ family protein [Elusimicrobia bacterium]|nr:PorV/PorQ family protein [Elusimicrobiota bacterium]
MRRLLRKVAAGACVAFLLVDGARAATFSSDAIGTTTAGFLKLGAGARAAAMGEAFSAVADDATALYWNPGALTRVPSKSATFMHAAYFASSSFDYASYAQNLGNYGAFGVGLQYFSAGAIARTDDTGTDVGSFSPNDLAVTGGYAYEMQNAPLSELDGWSVGIAGKFVQSKIIATAKTGAADVGLLSRTYWDRMRFAATVVNLGGRMTYLQGSEPLPVAGRLGASAKLTKRWTAALDFAAPRDNRPYAALGTEYWWPVGSSVRIAGRAGFNSRSIDGIDGFRAASFGFGLGVGGLGFDYALVPFGAIGLAHRMSLSLAW